jgi:hypothetical protein
MAILRDPPASRGGASWPNLARTPIGDRIRYLSSMADVVAHGIVGERSRLTAELKSHANEAEIMLGNWLAKQRARLEEAKVTDPSLESGEGRAERYAMAMAAEDLSALPTDQLVATGHQALARGDVREARIRLRAARIKAEQWKAGTINDFAKAVDAVLDQTLPHRQAALAELDRVHSDYGRVISTLAYVDQITQRLARDPAPAEAVDPGDGATPQDRQMALADSHEHVMAKLAEWLRANATEEVAA